MTATPVRKLIFVYLAHAQAAMLLHAQQLMSVTILGFAILWLERVPTRQKVMAPFVTMRIFVQRVTFASMAPAVEQRFHATMATVVPMTRAVPK
jgi:hypothetical protein